ncbi:MAG: BON domain-containing protein [Steroidobacteraceae bacterium]|jgi:osmotically-inducible protein OsmY
MNITIKKRIWCICAFLGPVVGGLSALATQSVAQNAAASVEHPLRTDATSPSRVADPVADEVLRGRVETALHSDPYFYDVHVTVSVEKGAVVLRGFVSSDWDLLDAIRIASRAAGDRRVIDELTIELGGRR